jgi:U3 small nucleolar ribonucleoprotein protein IMP4
MLKKNLRERKEFLYKRQEEVKAKIIQERKQRMKKQLQQSENRDEMDPKDSSKNVMKLYRKNKDLIHNIEADDMETELPYTAMDDEYKSMNYREPKVLITTSRDCSNRLQQFMKEFRLLVPNSIKINRGNLVIKELVQVAKEKEFTDIILLHENRGEPDGIIVSHLPYGPTTYFGLFNVVLRHDIKQDTLDHISEAFPHLIFDGFSSRVGERISEILKNLFPIPKLDSSRVLTFHNNDDIISFRHHTFVKKNKTDDCRPVDVVIKEHGPRFDMRPYQISLGTLDMPEAQKEWVLRPFMNTSVKKNAL